MLTDSRGRIHARSVELKPLAKTYFRLPVVMRGLLLIVVSSVLLFAIGNGTSLRFWSGFALVAALSVAFVWIEGYRPGGTRPVWHRHPREG